MRCVVHRRPLPMDRVRANRHRRTGVGGDAYSNSIRTHALTVEHAQARTLMQARTCCNDRSACGGRTIHSMMSSFAPSTAACTGTHAIAPSACSGECG